MTAKKRRQQAIKDRKRSMHTRSHTSLSLCVALYPKSLGLCAGQDLPRFVVVILPVVRMGAGHARIGPTDLSSFCSTQCIHLILIVLATRSRCDRFDSCADFGCEPRVSPAAQAGCYSNRVLHVLALCSDVLTVLQVVLIRCGATLAYPCAIAMLMIP